MKRATKRVPKPIPTRRRTAHRLSAQNAVKQDSTALAKTGQTALLRPVSAIPSIKDTIGNLEQVRRFVSRCLNTDLQRELAKLSAQAGLTPDEKLKKEGELRTRLEIDWGTIPGVDKPFLMQPGAEKVMFWLALRPQYHRTVLDLSAGHIEVLASVDFYSKKTGELVFQGPECSCTTMEDNYRFRWVERDEKSVQPSRDEAERLKAARMGRWRRKQVYARGKPTEVKWVWEDRVENPNIWNERNKVRQIAQKRGLVKGVRNMGALSEIFVSDPGEWNLPDEDRGAPYVDEQYTEGGRRIVPNDPAPSAEATHFERYMDRLTPEQRKAEEESLARGKQKLEELKAKQAPSGTMERLFDSLVYAPFEDPDFSKGDAFVIAGPTIMIDAQRDTLRRFWNPRKAKLICNGEELEALKYTFQQRGVAFKPISQ